MSRRIPRSWSAILASLGLLVALLSPAPAVTHSNPTDHYYQDCDASNEPDDYTQGYVTTTEGVGGNDPVYASLGRAAQIEALHPCVNPSTAYVQGLSMIWPANLSNNDNTTGNLNMLNQLGYMQMDCATPTTCAGSYDPYPADYPENVNFFAWTPDPYNDTGRGYGAYEEATWYDEGTGTPKTPELTDEYKFWIYADTQWLPPSGPAINVWRYCIQNVTDGTASDCTYTNRKAQVEGGHGDQSYHLIETLNSASQYGGITGNRQDITDMYYKTGSLTSSPWLALDITATQCSEVPDSIYWPNGYHCVGVPSNDTFYGYTSWHGYF